MLVISYAERLYIVHNIVSNKISSILHRATIVIRHLIEGDYSTLMISYAERLYIVHNIVSNIISSILRRATIVGCNMPFYIGRL